LKGSSGTWVKAQGLLCHISLHLSNMSLSLQLGKSKFAYGMDLSFLLKRRTSTPKQEAHCLSLCLPTWLGRIRLMFLSSASIHETNKMIYWVPTSYQALFQKAEILLM
jgi:hypothetical protein